MHDVYSFVCTGVLCISDDIDARVNIRSGKGGASNERLPSMQNSVTDTSH